MDNLILIQGEKGLDQSELLLKQARLLAARLERLTPDHSPRGGIGAPRWIDADAASRVARCTPLAMGAHAGTGGDRLTE